MYEVTTNKQLCRTDVCGRVIAALFVVACLGLRVGQLQNVLQCVVGINVCRAKNKSLCGRSVEMQIVTALNRNKLSPVIVMSSVVVVSKTIGYNVPTLGAVGDFGKLNCQPAQIYNRSIKFQLTMLAPIAPNVC